LAEINTALTFGAKRSEQALYKSFAIYSEQAFVLPAATVVHGVLQCCVALPVNAAKNIPKTKMPASFDTGIVSFCSGLRQNPRPHGVGVA
jgi:hypothetical protein